VIVHHAGRSEAVNMIEAHKTTHSCFGRKEAIRRNSIYPGIEHRSSTEKQIGHGRVSP
jgi:hypothetical protein